MEQTASTIITNRKIAIENSERDGCGYVPIIYKNKWRAGIGPWAISKLLSWPLCMHLLWEQPLVTCISLPCAVGHWEKVIFLDKVTPINSRAFSEVTEVLW